MLQWCIPIYAEWVVLPVVFAIFWSQILISSIKFVPFKFACLLVIVIVINPIISVLLDIF
jgi:hypothetical protein